MPGSSPFHIIFFLSFIPACSSVTKLVYLYQCHHVKYWYFIFKDIFLDKICYNNELHNNMTSETNLDTLIFFICIFKVQYFLKHFRHNELFDLYIIVQHFLKHFRHHELFDLYFWSFFFLNIKAYNSKQY